MLQSLTRNFIKVTVSELAFFFHDPLAAKWVNHAVKFGHRLDEYRGWTFLIGKNEVLELFCCFAFQKNLHCEKNENIFGVSFECFSGQSSIRISYEAVFDNLNLFIESAFSSEFVATFFRAVESGNSFLNPYLTTINKLVFSGMIIYIFLDIISNMEGKSSTTSCVFLYYCQLHDYTILSKSYNSLTFGLQKFFHTKLL